MTATIDFKQYWIGNQPNPEDRQIILVSNEDASKINALMRDEAETVECFDHTTQKTVKLKRASCGLGCKCALQFVA